MNAVDNEQLPHTRPAPSRFSWRTAGYLGLACLIFLRLFLTGDRDILALNSPYDEYWFVHNASRMIWGGGYSQMAFPHLPLYSMWLVVLNTLGIPARLGIDLAWIAATAYAGFSLIRFTGRRWVGIAFWLLCMFHPLLIALFDRALSETLLVVLMAVLLGSGLEVWNTRLAPFSRRGRIATVCFVIALALAYHVRKEGVVFLAPLAVLAAGSWFRRKDWWSRPLSPALGGRLLVLPLAAVVFLGVLLASANLVRWGVPVRYELGAPEYQRAMAALNRIDVGRGPLYVTVTRQARQLAYQYSPTFAELKPFFEGTPGRFLENHTARFTGQPGEIGNGWFYWALRDAAAGAGWHSDARTAEKKYGALADELEQAFQSGKLKSYSSLLPGFLDPDLGKWIGRVPGSSFAALGLLFETNPDSVKAVAEDASIKQFEEYMQMVGRRNALPSVSAKGWIILPEGSSVGLAAPGQEPAAWVQLKGPVRPDVPGALPFSVASSSAELPGALRARTPDGKVGEVSINSLKEGAMSKVEGDVSAPLGIDELSTGLRSTRLERWASYLAKRPVQFDWVGAFGGAYRWIVLSLGGIFALSVIGGLATRRLGKEVLALFVLCLVASLARVALFGILDASSWSGVQARYMAPLIPVSLFIGLLACWSVARAWAGRHSDK